MSIARFPQVSFCYEIIKQEGRCEYVSKLLYSNSQEY
jgi:hypothetical protein